VTHLDSKSPAEQRAFLIYYARITLREARARRQDRSFSATLLGWAANARRQAMAIRPEQGDLFGRVL
jgi:hypothetical protein